MEYGKEGNQGLSTNKGLFMLLYIVLHGLSSKERDFIRYYVEQQWREV
jgi:hypothetical protein